MTLPRRARIGLNTCHVVCPTGELGGVSSGDSRLFDIIIFRIRNDTNIDVAIDGRSDDAM